MTVRRGKVLVAMSGGVDSSVAAARLQEAGHDVVGAFMRNGVTRTAGVGPAQGCCGLEDARDARRVADRLGIPFYVVNLAEAFEGLVSDFTRSYVAGRTPNPCIECNRRFKFGSLLRLARDLDAGHVATGHYARIVELDGRRAIAMAPDRSKDQSYVLFPLTQEVLERTLLPLGSLTKAEVRAEARRFDLPVAAKAESMEICFVPSGDYRDVLRARRPDALVPGPIVNAAGQELGRHAGTALFTIGQRRGLPGGQGRALYVTALDPERATVTVGGREDLLSSGFVLEEVVWSGVTPVRPGTVWEGWIRIRHHHDPVPGEARLEPDGRVTCRLAEPASAVTPGQAGVLYDGQGRILLGGWIAQGCGRE